MKTKLLLLWSKIRRLALAAKWWLCCLLGIHLWNYWTVEGAAAFSWFSYRSCLRCGLVQKFDKERGGWYRVV